MIPGLRALSAQVFTEFAQLLSAATGICFTAEQLLTTGERIYNVERAFNSKCHLTREDDNVPDKFFTDPIETKLRVLNRKEFESLKDTYYQLRGWDVATGHPTPQKLRELGLSDIAKDFEPQKTKSAGVRKNAKT